MSLFKGVMSFFCFFGGMSIGLLNAQPAENCFAQMDSLLELEEKPMVIFIHTDWCKYCLKMWHTTFKDSGVISTLEKKTYFLSLDAQYTQDIVFRGKTFSYVPNGNRSGVHQLAIELGGINGQLHYPTLCILNKNNEILFQYSGFISSLEMHEILEALPQ